MGSGGGGPREGPGGLRRPFAGAGRGGRGGPASPRAVTRGTAPACVRQSPLPRHLVSPLGAQFPRPLSSALDLVPLPAQQPWSSASVPPLSCFASSFLFCTPRPAFSSASHKPGSPARLVPAPLPAPKYRETLHPDAAAVHAAVHPARAKAAGRGRRGRRGPRSCSAGSPRIRRLWLGVRAWAGRGRGRGSPPAGELVARSPEPGRPGPESGLAAGWGLVSLQQEDARP